MESSVGAYLEPTLLFWCSLGVIALAAGLLVVTRYAPARVAHRITAGCGLLLAVAAVGVLLISPVVSLVLLGLALLCAVAWAADSDQAKRVAAWALRPGLIWTAALLAFLGIARLVAWQPIPDEQFARDPGTDVQSEAIVDMHASTDRGRAIRLVCYAEYPALQKLESEFLSDRVYRNEIIRLAGPNLACNCHGWVFAGGQFGVRGTDVFPLLADNGYRPIAQPQPGDLIVYHNQRGEATHTGVVRMVDENSLVLIESKWGPLGVYLHRPKSQPFGQEFAYYRSPRDGHRIKLDPGSSSEDLSPAATTAKAGIRRPGPMGVKNSKVRTRQS